MATRHPQQGARLSPLTVAQIIIAAALLAVSVYQWIQGGRDV